MAEVLVTLGIIGVIASLTLPSLIAKYKDKELIAATKKTYSVIQNALLTAQNEGGTIGDNTYLFDTNQTSVELAQKLLKYFNAAKLCENENSADCSKYFDITYKYAVKQVSNGSNAGQKLNYPRLLLADGSVLAVKQQPSCSNHWETCEQDENGYCKKDENGNDIMVQGGDDACGYIYFDVNGLKGPNQYGRDAYALKIRINNVTGIYYNPTGSQSLKNILSGKDELIYEKYNLGDNNGRKKQQRKNR